MPRIHIVVLDAESLAADVLHLALILLMDELHDKAHQHRAFAAQLLQVYFLRIVRAVHCLAVMDEVVHIRLLGRDSECRHKGSASHFSQFMFFK